MTKIHPTAVIDPSAEIDPSATIGPYTVIGPHVAIAKDAIIGPHVVIDQHTRIGERTVISASSALGGPPQDLGYKGETSWVEIGNDVQIREFVTIHRASGEGLKTVVGDGCLIMSTTHIGHNCHFGQHAILATGSILAGHVTVGDYAFISGQNVIHQHCRIGAYSILGGGSALRVDVPPYCKADGRPALLRGLNTVGLRRQGFTVEQRQAIKRAYMTLWHSHLNTRQAIAYIRQQDGLIDPVVEDLLQFMEQSRRGVAHPERQARSSGEAISTGDDPTEMASSQATTDDPGLFVETGYVL